jgi:hypothetical protein
MSAEMGHHMLKDSPAAPSKKGKSAGTENAYYRHEASLDAVRSLQELLPHRLTDKVLDLGFQPPSTFPRRGTPGSQIRQQTRPSSMAFDQHVDLAPRYPQRHAAASTAARPTIARAANGAITADTIFVRSHKTSGIVNVPDSAKRTDSASTPPPPYCAEE